MGKVCKIPRQQTAFGDSGLDYSFSGITLPANKCTPTVYKIKLSVEEALDENFNFVLVNRYKDGGDSIGEHRDDEVDLVAKAPLLLSPSVNQENSSSNTRTAGVRMHPEKTFNLLKSTLNMAASW